MRIGIAFDLKSDFVSDASAPEDALEEYDSTATVDAIAGVLTELGHSAEKLGGGKRFVERLLASPPDLVFNIAEGAAGSRSREAHVPAVCEMLKVPCTHSDPLTLALTLDKALAKRVASSYGVATPRFVVVDSVADVERVTLPFPLIAKPMFEGSSMGIRRHSRVTDVTALWREVARIVDDYHQPALVEEFCTGPEFTVGVLGEGSSARAIGVMEIVPRLARPTEFVYSLEVKRDWENEVEYHVPPKRDALVIAAITECALSAHRALGCRDVSRVDVRLDAAGTPCFLEVNPLPGLNPRTGDLCILSGRSGLTYSGLIEAIVRGALARNGLA
ncbi:MAG: D-alanine--D-alanine ligase [Planctomycetota bacterium]|nr:D-alanine--D-alanine ligase [Planctomycetota bacterium]